MRIDAARVVLELPRECLGDDDDEVPAKDDPHNASKTNNNESFADSSIGCSTDADWESAEAPPLADRVEKARTDGGRTTAESCFFFLVVAVTIVVGPQRRISSSIFTMTFTSDVARSHVAPSIHTKREPNCAWSLAVLLAVDDEEEVVEAGPRNIAKLISSVLRMQYKRTCGDATHAKCSSRAAQQNANTTR